MAWLYCGQAAVPGGAQSFAGWGENSSAYVSMKRREAGAGMGVSEAASCMRGADATRGVATATLLKRGGGLRSERQTFAPPARCSEEALIVVERRYAAQQRAATVVERRLC